MNTFPIVVMPPLHSSSANNEVESFGWGDFPLVTESPSMVSYTSPSGPFSSPPPTTTTSPPSLCVGRKRTLPQRNGCLFAVDDSFSVISSSSSDDEEEEETLSVTSMDVSDDGCTTSAASPSRRSKNKGRSVRFSSVHVQEHAVVLGDHPWSQEYPLTLDWRHSSPTLYSVDEYETHGRRRTSLSSSSPPQRLSPLERRLRLEIVNELSQDQVQEAEQERQRNKIHEMQRFPCSNSPVRLFSQGFDEARGTSESPCYLPKRQSCVFTSLTVE